MLGPTTWPVEKRGSSTVNVAGVAHHLHRQVAAGDEPAAEAGTHDDRLALAQAREQRMRSARPGPRAHSDLLVVGGGVMGLFTAYHASAAARSRRGPRARARRRSHDGFVRSHALVYCFSGHREELLENGKLNPAMVDGRKRKIIFDIGHGAGQFLLVRGGAGLPAGFYPDSISTDLHINSMNGGMKDMANTMSKLLNLGSSVADVIRMSTWNPAKEIRRPQLGNLDEGADADIAVLRLERGKFGFLDSAGALRPGDQKLVCELTLRAGKVVWDLNGRAAEDWQKFPYQKRSWTQK